MGIEHSYGYLIMMQNGCQLWTNGHLQDYHGDQLLIGAANYLAVVIFLQQKLMMRVLEGGGWMPMICRPIRIKLRTAAIIDHVLPRFYK